MSIKQSQRVTRSILQGLDSGIWQNISQKAISKMPRIQLSIQSNRVFHDFALINGNIHPKQKHCLGQESQKTQSCFDSRLVGSIRNVSKLRKYSKTQISNCSQQKKYQLSPLIISPNKKYLQQTAAKDELSLKNPQIYTKLFISSPLNQEQLRHENILRKTKMENMLYNKRLEDLARQRESSKNDRSQSEGKKIKQMKNFTYDYQGKLLSTNIKNNGNIKFIHLKSKFNHNLTKEHKALIQKLHKTKYSQVTNKKTIYFDNNDSIVPERQQKMKGVVGFNNSIINLFKDDNGIQMGVSVTDVINKSKIMGNQLKSKAMKLGDFKKTFKSTSMIYQKRNDKVKTQQAINEKERLKTSSDIESKLISSSFSRYSRQNGFININEKPFMASFFNDGL